MATIAHEWPSDILPSAGSTFGIDFDLAATVAASRVRKIGDFGGHLWRWRLVFSDRSEAEAHRIQAFLNKAAGEPFLIRALWHIRPLGNVTLANDARTQSGQLGKTLTLTFNGGAPADPAFKAGDVFSFITQDNEHRLVQVDDDTTGGTVNVSPALQQATPSLGIVFYGGNQNTERWARATMILVDYNVQRSWGRPNFSTIAVNMIEWYPD